MVCWAWTAAQTSRRRAFSASTNNTPLVRISIKAATPTRGQWALPPQQQQQRAQEAMLGDCHLIHHLIHHLHLTETQQAAQRAGRGEEEGASRPPLPEEEEALLGCRISISISSEGRGGTTQRIWNSFHCTSAETEGRLRRKWLNKKRRRRHCEEEGSNNSTIAITTNSNSNSSNKRLRIGLAVTPIINISSSFNTFSTHLRWRWDQQQQHQQQH